MSPKTVQKKHTFLETKIKNKFLPKVCRKRSLCDMNNGFSKSRLCSLCSPQKLKAFTKAPFSKASLQRPPFCGQLLGSLLVWLRQRQNLQSISAFSFRPWLISQILELYVMIFIAIWWQRAQGCTFCKVCFCK